METACLFKLIGKSVVQNLPRPEGEKVSIAQDYPWLEGKDLVDFKGNAARTISMSMILELRDKYGWNLHICEAEDLIKAYE